MCGRYVLKSSADEIAQACDVPHVVDAPPLKPRYNIAPSQLAAVVRNEGDGRELDLLKWGLVPSWSESPKDGGYSTINARAEGIEKKSAYRKPLKERRCLVPADGYYQWLKIGRLKQPLLFRMKDERPFAFAGLWDRWQSDSGKPLDTFTIITTAASARLSPVHERMPAILDPHDYALWLEPSVKDPARLLPLLVPYTSDDLDAVPVSTLVNNPKHRGPECVEPVTDPDVLKRVREALGTV